MTAKDQIAGKPPEWLLRLKDKGFEPYIATSTKLVPFLEISPYGQKAKVHVMEDIGDDSFMQAYFMLEAYLLSNSLGFAPPDRAIPLKMPHWVLVDCVLMQTAVVGFTVPKASLPEELFVYFRDDENIDINKLDRIPVSGQICATNFGNTSMTGISLFSLGRRWLKNVERLGLYTKALALEVYRYKNHPTYYGVTQYDSTSMRIHGRFAREMEIYQATVPLHPAKDMTFIYKMELIDPHQLEDKLSQAEPTFWLNAQDAGKKRAIAQGLKKGKRYIISAPFSEQRGEETFLPIIEKDA